ncbi:cyclin-dependent protein serine/threonine kinase [Aureococcus anophagefferens]|nr:cyclin-dependent protein serine/threonine kinase [Aureococcus anophagefferens]
MSGVEFVRQSSAPGGAKDGPRSEPFFDHGACESVSGRYEKRDRIGEGTYGIIYRAFDRRLQRLAAAAEAPGHASVVTFLDVAVGAKRDAVFLVLEYAEHGDLGSLLDDPKLRRPGQARLFDDSQTKALARMLLNALRHCHDRFVAHRDVKVANLLYTARGQLKICDFGLACVIAVADGAAAPGDPGAVRALTMNVVTLWYRAPELLLHARRYDHAIGTEDDQFAKVVDVIGAPSARVWRGFDELPRVKDGSARVPTNPSAYYSKLKIKVPEADDRALDFLSSLLCYDPVQRATAPEALGRAWFDDHPRPAAPLAMPQFPPRREEPPPPETRKRGRDAR